MPKFADAYQSLFLRWTIGITSLAVFFYFVPLFHIVPLKAARQQSASAVFNAAVYVEKFWNGLLLDAVQNSVDAVELLAALQRDTADAATRFGHRLGLSSNASYFVSGQGKIVSVNDNMISIALKKDGPVAVIIETGPVFGNAIRDGSGLLDVSDFANGQDFNAISSEINRRVEEQVLPQLAEKAASGMEVRFVGGVDVTDAEGVPSALTLVPVIIEFP